MIHIESFDCIYIHSFADVEHSHNSTHSFLPDPIKCLLKVNEVVKEWLLICSKLLTQHSQIEDLLCCTTTLPESCLLLSNDFFCLRPQSVKNDSQEYLSRVTYQANGAVVTAGFEVTFLWKRNDE